MGRSRSPESRKKIHRRSTSRSKHSKKSHRRTPERKSSSKYRHRSESLSDSSSNRYKSSSKYKSKRPNRRDSRSPSTSHRRHRRRSSSSSNSSSRSSSSSSSSNESKKTHRSSSSSDKLHKNKPSSSYINKIRAMRTPTPPKQSFEVNVEVLDRRHLSDALEEINANEFRPKSFNSTATNKTDKNGKTDADIIKIKGETKAVRIDSNDDPLFHQNVSLNIILLNIDKYQMNSFKNFDLQVFGDDDVRMERWVRRLYNYRQKFFASNN